jgi:hypothetical protein
VSSRMAGPLFSLDSGPTPVNEAAAGFGVAREPFDPMCSKLVLMLVVAAFATSPAAAATKQKTVKQTTEAEEIAKQHDNTRRALRDALPLVLPSWSLPIYFGMNLDQTKDETGRDVQAWSEADFKTSPGYEPVICLACLSVHLVDPKTGRVLGSDNDE